MRWLVAVLLLFLACLCEGQAMTLADAKARKATQLGVTDLKQLMPGAKVVSHADDGSTRVWENKLNGTLVASTEYWDRSTFGRDVIASSAHGRWGVGEEGRYCVSIEWSSASEDWCRYIFKLGDKYYGFMTLETNAPGSEFEFSK
jgi:hypothetical protein